MTVADREKVVSIASAGIFIAIYVLSYFSEDFHFPFFTAAMSCAFVYAAFFMCSDEKFARTIGKWGWSDYSEIAVLAGGFTALAAFSLSADVYVFAILFVASYCVFLFCLAWNAGR